MKRILFFLILSISLSAYSQKSIPNISLSDFEGEKTKIFEAIDENQITVISLWATWCVPCIKELDAINEESTKIPSIIPFGVEKNDFLYLNQENRNDT